MSGWYLQGLEALLARTIPEASSVYALGVNEDYTFNETHTDLTGTVGHELLPEIALAGVTFTAGVLNAADQEWANAGAGIVDRSLVLTGVLIYFKDGTTPILLAYIDSATVGLPQTLEGINVTAQWDARGILVL